MTERAWLFTIATAGRQALLTRPEILAALREALAAERRRGAFHVLGLVVLPDHLHGVCAAAAGGRLPCWRRLKLEIFRRARAAVPDLPYPFWHPGHEARPLEGGDELDRELERLHGDPVRHRLVDEAGDWPWSTRRRTDGTPARSAGRRPAPARRFTAAVPTPIAARAAAAAGRHASSRPVVWR